MLLSSRRIGTVPLYLVPPTHRQNKYQKHQSFSAWKVLKNDFMFACVRLLARRGVKKCDLSSTHVRYYHPVLAAFRAPRCGSSPLLPAEDGELLSGSSPNSLRVGHLGTGECVSVSQKWSFLGSYQLQCSGSRAEIEGMCVRVCVRVSVSGGQARLLPWINLNSGCAAFK